ncbi:MAG: hypothetical protein QOC81_4722 [Thermoanaerobaculia bacterium]|jgi:hypothetical protein|nr:hypothetical protein [Thermoanaerobaculia bacterium]
MLVLFFAKYAAILALLLITAVAAGTLVVGGEDGLAFRAAVGLALCGHACFLLAAIGQLRAIPLIALMAAALTGGAMRFRGIEWLAASRIGVCAVVIVPLFVFALYPPLAFDETTYHLRFIRSLAHHGALRFLPDVRFPVFPQLHESLCVPLFLLGGDTATHLVALAEAVVTAALLVAWGSRHDTRAGWLAAAFFLGSPLVTSLATITYVDAALALFVTAGFYALDRERFGLAGYFLGTACSVKYLGGYFAVAALIIVLVRTAGRRRNAGAFMIACAAAALPVTTWIFVTTHNPVFPFFGSSLWVVPPESPISLGGRAIRVLRVSWDVTFARYRTNYQPPVTPLLIPIVAIVAIAAIRDRRARWVAALCAGHVMIFTFLPQDSRYLVPLLPLLSITAALSIAATRWARASALIALVAVLPGVAYAGYREALLGLPPPATESQRAEWLGEHAPGYRAVVRAGNARIYVCGGERLKDYASGELLGDFNGPFSFDRILGGAHDSAAIAQRLRSIRAAYFLVVKSNCAPPAATGGMVLTYEDAVSQLWLVQPSSAR